MLCKQAIKKLSVSASWNIKCSLLKVLTSVLLYWYNEITDVQLFIQVSQCIVKALTSTSISFTSKYHYCSPKKSFYILSSFQLNFSQWINHLLCFPRKSEWERRQHMMHIIWTNVFLTFFWMLNSFNLFCKQEHPPTQWTGTQMGICFKYV